MLNNRLASWLVTVAWSICLCIGLIGCQTNPATGKNSFNMISESQEISIGEQAEPDLIKGYGGEVADAQVVQHVKDIGMKMAQVSERPDLPWNFHIVDSAVINAFALPGGKIFITRGLLEKFNSDAQLAGVLGHEIGHVTAMHIGQQMSKQLLLMGVLVGAGIAIDDDDTAQWVTIIGGAAGSFYMLSYSRDHELQSDLLGLRYMSKVGYAPGEMIGVMEVLKEASGGKSPPEMLSTHPLPDTRIDRLRELVGTQYAHTVNNPKFIKGKDSYKTNVLDRLKKLPPPTHGTKKE